MVLTFFCWCPIFYGSYGAAKRVFGVPVWAVAAAGFGVALFALEWVYLFATRITISDEEVDGIVSEIAQVNTGAGEAGKEGE